MKSIKLGYELCERFIYQVHTSNHKQEDFSKQNQWIAHEEAIELCRNDHLDQAVYFLLRDLIFMRDVSVKVPYESSYTFYSRSTGKSFK